MVTPTLIAMRPSEQANRLVDRLCEWAACGLLTPFGVIELGPEGPASVRHVNGPEVRTRSIADILTGQAAGVRLVAVRFVTPDDTPDAAFADQTRALLDHLQQIVPFDPDPEVRPRAFSVFVPDRLGAEVPLSALDPSTDVAVVLAAESRQAPGEPNVLVEDPDVVIGHAAHGVAAVCQLWAGVDQPGDPDLLALLAQHAAGPETEAVAVQCWTRGLNVGFVADQVAAQVLRADDGWPNPDPRAFDRVADDDGAWRELRTYLSTRHQQAHASVLMRTPLDPLRYEPRVYGLLTAIKLFLRRLWDAIRRRPFEMIEDAVARTYNAQASRVERYTGLLVKRWTVGPTIPRQIADSVGVVPRTLKDPPVAATWRDLLQLVVGLTDGAPLPSFVDPGAMMTGEDKRRLVTDPARLVPKPALTVRDGQVQRACDPLRLDPEVLALADPSLDLDAAMNSTIAEARTSLVWDAGRRLATELELARLRAEQLDALLAVDEDVPEDEQAVRKKPRRRIPWRGLLLTTAWVGLATLAGRELEDPQRTACWIGLAVSYPVLLLILGALALRRREREQERAIQEELDRINAIAAAAQARDDAVLLRRRYAEYLDWAELVGHVVHEPWATLEGADATPPPMPDAQGLPPSFTFASAHVGAGDLQVLAVRARNALYQVRWLTLLLADLERRAMLEHVRAVHGLARDEEDEVALPDPATDLSSDPRSPRRAFLSYVRDPASRSTSGSRRLLDHLATVPLEDLVTQVTMDELADGGLAPTAAWLGEIADLPALTKRLSASVLRVLVEEGEGKTSQGSGVAVGTHLVVSNRHVVDDVDGRIVVVASDGSEVQVESWRLSESSDLALLRLPADAPPLVAVELTDGAVVQGQKVVTLGFPLGLEGQPSLAMGVVTAAERVLDAEELLGPGRRIRAIQVDCRVTFGASGSGLFDAAGKMVGVIARVSVDRVEERLADYLSFACPMAEVHALIADDDLGPRAEPAADEGDRPDLQPLKAFVSAIRTERGRPQFVPKGVVDDPVTAFAWNTEEARTLAGCDFGQPLRTVWTSGCAARPVPLHSGDQQ